MQLWYFAPIVAALKLKTLDRQQVYHFAPEVPDGYVSLLDPGGSFRGYDDGDITVGS